MKRTEKIFTVRDARLEKLLRDERTEAAAQRRSERAERRLNGPEADPQHPRIGKLIRNGKSVYYAFVGGAYTEGLPSQLLAKIRLED